VPVGSSRSRKTEGTSRQEEEQQQQEEEEEEEKSGNRGGRRSRGRFGDCLENVWRLLGLGLQRCL
jgi:hypothetical protein